MAGFRNSVKVNEWNKLMEEMAKADTEAERKKLSERIILDVLNVTQEPAIGYRLFFIQALLEELPRNQLEVTDKISKELLALLKLFLQQPENSGNLKGSVCVIEHRHLIKIMTRISATYEAFRELIPQTVAKCLLPIVASGSLTLLPECTDFLIVIASCGSLSANALNNVYGKILERMKTEEDLNLDETKSVFQFISACIAVQPAADLETLPENLRQTLLAIMQKSGATDISAVKTMMAECLRHASAVVAWEQLFAPWWAQIHIAPDGCTDALKVIISNEAYTAFQKNSHGEKFLTEIMNGFLEFENSSIVYDSWVQIHYLFSDFIKRNHDAYKELQRNHKLPEGGEKY